MREQCFVCGDWLLPCYDAVIVKCLAPIIGIIVAQPAAAGSLFYEQPHDFVAFSPSERNTAIGSATTADDVNLDAIETLTGITAMMIVTASSIPTEYRLDFYHDGGSGPGDLIETIVGEIDENFGSWNSNTDLNLVRVRFSFDATATPGRFWISPYAIGSGLADQRAYWGTAGNGNVAGSQGYFMSDELGFPDWTPVSDPNLLGFETDFAFTLERIPAPGTLAVFGLLALSARRRRVG